MTMRVRIQLLALEHCWSILTGSCLTTLLTAIIALRETYHLFTYLKNWLRSQSFNSNEELMEGSSQAADLLNTGIQKLIPRYDKCLNSGSDYVEK
jgi:hypothetical protein